MMENEIDQETSKIPQKITSLPLAIILFLVSYLMVFATQFYETHGVYFSMVLFNHTQGFVEIAANVLGYSAGLPIIHVGIASIFKSKRNPSTRRNIFIGWSVIMILVQARNLYLI